MKALQLVQNNEEIIIILEKMCKFYTFSLYFFVRMY